MQLLSYGGITQEINVPGQNGQTADVVLGFKTLQDYVTNDSPPVTANGGPYFGETVGRYANRIAKGTFKLNGADLHAADQQRGQLAARRPRRVRQPHLVPGRRSSTPAARSASRCSWSARTATPAARPAAPAARTGCTGYPAKLTVDVTFTLNNAGQYGIHYSAHNDDAKLSTVLNLTNHSYFNLAGENSAAGSAYGQYVQINANNYSPTDTTQIPLPLTNGVPVAGTPFDFTRPAHDRVADRRRERAGQRPASFSA